MPSPPSDPHTREVHLTEQMIAALPENPAWGSEASLLKDYFSLSDAALRSRHAPEQGRFIAETTLIVERALAAGYRPRSVLCSPADLPEIRRLLADHPDHEAVVPVFVGEPSVLEQLTGFHLHRGALASMHRKPLPSAAEVLEGASRVLVLEDLVDHTNLGAIIRSAAALGADAIILSPGCADPLYRRAIRTSMGASLTARISRIPTAQQWAGLCDLLHSAGFSTAAMALTERAQPLQRYSAGLRAENPVALFLGSEGPGLSAGVLDQVQQHVIIPMHAGTDSLNVAQAATVALWELNRDLG